MTHFFPVRQSYDFVQPNIAMGGAVLDSTALFEEFDIIVMCAGEWQPTLTLPEDRTKRVIRLPFDDTYEALIPSVLRSLHLTANELVAQHKTGKRILITCMAGRNRSGILAGLVLMKRFGMSGDEAILVIRDARGPAALSNPSFSSYLQSLHL